MPLLCNADNVRYVGGFSSMKEDKLNPAIIEHITKEANQIDHGSIKIILNKNAEHVDVIIEDRKRFSTSKDQYRRG